MEDEASIRSIRAVAAPTRNMFQLVQTKRCDRYLCGSALWIKDQLDRLMIKAATTFLFSPSATNEGPRKDPVSMGTTAASPRNAVRDPCPLASFAPLSLL